MSKRKTYIAQNVYNTKLYNYIVTYYVNAKKPKKIKEMAEELGVSVGGIRNFMYRHNLNKKNYYLKKYDTIIELYNAGLDIPNIAKTLDVSTSFVNNVIERLKIRQGSKNE